MTRKTRSASELRDLSGHLHYEFSMFATLARAMATGVFGTSPLNNAALESFTLPGRVLLDFLFAQKPWADDAIAEDFFEPPEDWARVRGEMPPVLKDLNSRVGKEVAHLTYARLLVGPDQKPWPFLAIESAMETVMARFVDHVPVANLSTEWQRPGTKRTVQVIGDTLYSADG